MYQALSRNSLGMYWVCITRGLFARWRCWRSSAICSLSHLSITMPRCLGLVQLLVRPVPVTFVLPSDSCLDVITKELVRHVHDGWGRALATLASWTNPATSTTLGARIRTLANTRTCATERGRLITSMYVSGSTTSRIVQEILICKMHLNFVQSVLQAGPSCTEAFQCSARRPTFWPPLLVYERAAGIIP